MQALADAPALRRGESWEGRVRLRFAPGEGSAAVAAQRMSEYSRSRPNGSILPPAGYERAGKAVLVSYGRFLKSDVVLDRTTAAAPVERAVHRTVAQRWAIVAEATASLGTRAPRG